jgi:type IV secretory pathway TrbD component
MSTQRPSGFETPVFRSLHEPILLGGAPRDFAIMHWLAAFVLSARVGFRAMWLVMLAAVVVHAAVAAGTKFDPHFMQVLSKAFRSPRRLDP